MQFDDTKLLTGSDDGSIKLWDLSTGRYVRDVVRHESVIWRLPFTATTLTAAYARPNGTSEILVMEFDEADASSAVTAATPTGLRTSTA